MKTVPAAATPGARDVILRDGTTMTLRAASATDGASALAFFGGLSERSLYRRFHGLPTVRPELVAPFLEPDWQETGSLVGTLVDHRGERVVAMASWARLREPTIAEVALAVGDEMQGRGVGTRLLEELAATAAAAGVRDFIAEVLPENGPMLEVFRSAGFASSRTTAGGTVEVRLSIVPTAEYQARVDQRDHVGVAASLRPFFAPRVVAVLGASARRGSIGGELFRNILAYDFAGVAYPINRDGVPVGGVRAYRRMDELPDGVDLAVVCLPAVHVLDAVADALEAGVRAFCVISAGFAEVGPDGAARQERLLELVRSYGGRLLGPNCLGLAVSAARLNATFAPGAFPRGRIGFSSQSGALGLAVLEEAGARGLGLSAFVSIGNKADVSSNDLLEWWEDDDDTSTILLYLESFGNPRKFARIARRVARTKPILALKSGTSAAGARAASSHTAALAGSDAAVDAVFRQSGVIRADTLAELFDIATLVDRQPLPRGARVAVVTNAGGLGILCADACGSVGLALPALDDSTVAALRQVLPVDASPANPIDMLGSATAADYEQALPLALHDPNVDAVVVIFVPPVGVGADDVEAAITRVANAPDRADKPLLVVIMSRLRDRSTSPAATDGALACFAYPESAARALGRAVERGEWLRRPAGVVPTIEPVDRAGARNVILGARSRGEDVWLEPDEARALLVSYGIPMVPQRTAATPEEATTAAAALGFPVVLKTAVAGAHKTESGGVALDLNDRASVAAAAERVGGPFLVQPMIKGGIELLAGVVQDPSFGPLVAFGPGGIFAELIGGASFRVAPLTDVDATELVLGGKAGRLVQGFRGAPGADVGALVDLVHRLACLAEDLPEVAELDLNPVLARATDCLVVDARVRVRPPAATTRRKSW